MPMRVTFSTDGSFLMKSSTNLIMAHHAAQGPTPTIQLEQPQKLGSINQPPTA